jgi:hypothetical protein
MSGVCEDAMLCQGVVCNDTNDCTADMCDPQDGQCDFNPVADDTPCGAGGSCTSGVCVVDPAPLTVVQNVNCTPLGIPVTVPVTLTVDPRGAFTSGGSATVDSVLDVVIDPSVGQLLINVFANDQATVGAAIVNVSVNGGTPSPIAHAVPGTPRVIDVDANDDGTADPVPLGTDTVTTIVTNDGSPNVSFSVTSISVQVTSPVNLTLDDTNCTVDPGSVSFPVNYRIPQSALVHLCDLPRSLLQPCRRCALERRRRIEA